VPLLGQKVAQSVVGGGHAIIEKASKWHPISIGKIVLVFTLKGLALPTLQNSTNLICLN
jgi:hypothetical protein